VCWGARRRGPGSAAPISIALAAILLALSLAACGESGGDPPASGAGPALVAPINLANCTDWKQASVDQRLATIDQVKEFVGGPVAGTEGSGGTLDDDKAYDLFENYCAEEFARGFKLYKLYSRAAAFSDQ
jgi:hypothetical protein